MEDILKKMEEIIKNMLDANPGVQNKGYSVSYRFGTGMDKPEIKINGSEDAHLNHKLTNMFEKLPLYDAAQKAPSISESTEMVHADPLVDIFEENDEYLVIAELPGTTKDEISLECISPRELEISTLSGRKIIILPGKYIAESAKARYNNGILEIRVKPDPTSSIIRKIHVD